MKDNCFTLPGASVITFFRCSLNCKYCASYVPYLKNTMERSNEVIMRGVERFFKIVDKIDMLTINGGEPLLYMDLPDLLERLLAYTDCFDRIQIITNGTIIPSDDVIKSVKKYGSKFYNFVIDNYGADVSKKVPEIETVLKNNNLPYFVRDYYSENMHYGGWIDLGDMRQEQHTLEEAQVVYEKCGIPPMGFCSFIADDIWYPCDQVFRRLDLGQEVSKDEYIDFTDETLTVEQQRDKLRKIFDGKCLETCKYCSGYCKDSIRIKPAEQLSSEELQQIKKDLSQA